MKIAITLRRRLSGLRLSSSKRRLKNQTISPQVPPQSGWSTMRLAAWFGLGAGFSEVVYLGVQKFLLRQPIYFSSHIIWMSPLANLRLFALHGLLFIAMGIASLRVKAGVMTFLALLGCSLVFQELKFYAVLLLAVGVAWRAGHLIAARAQGFHAFAERSARWMLVAS